MVRGVLHVPCPFRLPNMLSVRLLMVTTSDGLMLSMRTVYCTLPPGSFTVSGLAVLLTVIDEPWLTMVTVALPLPLAALPSSSAPLAVTRLVCVVLPAPCTSLVKVQLVLCPGWMVRGVVQVPCPFRLPNLSSTRLVMFTGSWLLLVLLICTVYCTLPPGSVTLVGLALLLTVMDGCALVSVTVALPCAFTGPPLAAVPLAVTWLTCVAPELPLMGLLKVHEYVPLRAMVCGTAQLPCPLRLPKTLSCRLLRVTPTAALAFLTCTVYCTLPPGSGRLAGLALLVTPMENCLTLPKLTTVSTQAGAAICRSLGELGRLPKPGGSVSRTVYVPACASVK